MKLIQSLEFSNIYEDENIIYKNIITRPLEQDLWLQTYLIRYNENKNFVKVLGFNKDNYLMMEKVKGFTLHEKLKSEYSNNMIRDIIKSYKKIISNIDLKPIEVIINDKKIEYVFYHNNMESWNNYIVNNKNELVLIDPNAFQFINVNNKNELEMCKWKRDQTLYNLNKLLS